MNSKWIFLLIVLFFMFFNAAYSQIRYEVVNGDTISIYRYEPENKIDIKLNASIKKEATDDYIYSYSVSSSTKSLQEIYTFKIYPLSKFEIYQTPSGWFKLTSQDNSEAIWASRDSINRISPGEQKSGFAIKSTDLPAINSFSGRGWVPVPAFNEIPDSTENSSINNDGKTGITIGPKALPDNISNPALIDTLQNYLSFSCDTTWIENQGICRSLEAKLENVERQLSRGNTNPARGSLQAFLNEVEALREKQLSPEAYALLYFNGQYLLERL